MTPSKLSSLDKKNRARKKNIDYVERMKGRKGKGHPFTIFTRGMDVCAVCQKPRSEHK